MYKRIMDSIRKLYDWVLGWAEHKWAVPALCVVSFTESSFFLVPPDVLLIAMGTSRPKRAFLYAFWTMFFSVLGALFGYYIGMVFWDSVKEYFFEYLFTQAQFDLVKLKFDDATFFVMFSAALTPIPFKAFTVFAGTLGAPILPFVLGSIAGRSIRYFLLAGLFFVFGEKIKDYVDKHFEKVTIRITLLFGLLILVYWYIKHGS